MVGKVFAARSGAMCTWAKEHPSDAASRQKYLLCTHRQAPFGKSADIDNETSSRIPCKAQTLDTMTKKQHFPIIVGSQRQSTWKRTLTSRHAAWKTVARVQGDERHRKKNARIVVDTANSMCLRIHELIVSTRFRSSAFLSQMSSSSSVSRREPVISRKLSRSRSSSFGSSPSPVPAVWSFAMAPVDQRHRDDLRSRKPELSVARRDDMLLLGYCPCPDPGPGELEGVALSAVP